MTRRLTRFLPMHRTGVSQDCVLLAGQVPSTDQRVVTYGGKKV
jgi:hypothetical protein